MIFTFLDLKLTSKAYKRA